MGSVKHSSLFCLKVSDKEKKFYMIGNRDIEVAADEASRVSLSQMPAAIAQLVEHSTANQTFKASKPATPWHREKMTKIKKSLKTSS
jgi:hypothetical protein